MLRSTIALALATVASAGTEYFMCDWRTMRGEYHYGRLIGKQEAENGEIVFDTQINFLTNDKEGETL